MISFGKWGSYGGQKCFFTHRNPKNGEVWSDDITYEEYDPTRRRKVIRYGMWVDSDKVKWL